MIFNILNHDDEGLMSNSKIPRRPGNTEAQIEDATRAGHYMADQWLEQAMKVENDDDKSLRMHTLEVACECALAVKFSNEIVHGGADLDKRIEKFALDLAKLVTAQVKYMKEQSDETEDNLT